MYFITAIILGKLLAAIQVLVALNMALSTAVALPITSKPIESTVENLAWQAWIELPPEQKQQVKSRKVTPKSIFTLPLRVECPEGHKQVDTKCIPIVIGTNEVLIDLNALGLLVGNVHTEDVYDYDDMGEEMTKPLSFDSKANAGDIEKSGDSKPSTKDEPLKFNIFKNKFHIMHEEPLEDYSQISNEGALSFDKEQTVSLTTLQPRNELSTSAIVANVTAINNLVNETSTISEGKFVFKKNSTSNDSEAEESIIFTDLADDRDFKIDAFSIPAFGSETLKPENENSIKLVTTTMVVVAANSTTSEKAKLPENDIQTLLQTESFLPLLNKTSATSFLIQEPKENISDISNLSLDEEITTLPNVKEPELGTKNKQEYTRSITVNPLISEESDYGDNDNDGSNDELKDSTLETVTNNEPSETTTPIQSDETTLMEAHSSLSTTSATQQELTELLMQLEQAQKDFEKLQRMRKGQKDQHVVSKKTKVQPVEVLSTTTEANKKTTTTATTATTTANLPTATKKEDELISSTAETVTPLFTVHNENDNNDRFYYQHLAAKQVNTKETQRKSVAVVAEAEVEAEAEAELPVTRAADGKITTKSTDIEAIPLTSEIDRTEEWRSINELVEGLQSDTALTSTTITTTTTEKPTTTTSQTITTQKSPSESSSVAKEPTLSTAQIWSKILPLLTTTSTTPMPDTSTDKGLQQKQLQLQNKTNSAKTTTSERSNRNSKIIRINSFNTISTPKLEPSVFKISSTTTKETIIVEDNETSSTNSNSRSTSSSTATTTAESSSSSEPYWWLPVAWRSLDKSTSNKNLQAEEEDEEVLKSEEQPLLLRFWSAYVPKSS